MITERTVLRPEQELRAEKLLQLPSRYYRVYTDPDVPCVEQNFSFVERVLSLPLAQTAVVLVDLWRTHYIDSWLRRAQEVTLAHILPLMEAARAAGFPL